MMDFGESHIKEHELNYPIRFHHVSDPNNIGTIYPVDGNDTKTVVFWKDGVASVDWSVLSCKRFIKNGDWIVEASGSAAEAPESASKDIAHFAIKVEAKDATEAVEALTQALVNCSRAYQHLKNVLGS